MRIQRQCVACKKSFSAKLKYRRNGTRLPSFCSRECYKTRYPKAMLPATVCPCGALIHERKAHCCASERLQWAAGVAMAKHYRPCLTCGIPTWHVPHRLGRPMVFCSQACLVAPRLGRGKKNYNNARQRAHRHGVTYEPVSRLRVFKRGGCCCALCGIATPRARMGTFLPDAPEMDHVMPISKGGAHSYSNVQLLCRKCNGIKSDMVPAHAQVSSNQSERVMGDELPGRPRGALAHARTSFRKAPQSGNQDAAWA